MFCQYPGIYGDSVRSSPAPCSLVDEEVTAGLACSRGLEGRGGEEPPGESSVEASGSIAHMFMGPFYVQSTELRAVGRRLQSRDLLGLACVAQWGVSQSHGGGGLPLGRGRGLGEEGTPLLCPLG